MMSKILNKIFKFDFSFYYEISSWSMEDWWYWGYWKLNEERGRMCDAMRDSLDRAMFEDIED